mmetsp:Transcript_12949/g.36723  ORF Transcript_12949/g.36723 Transcript_12949/m.36723 type:complete len:220 (+) Transcript_12949:1627-2286(+)
MLRIIDGHTLGEADVGRTQDRPPGIPHCLRDPLVPFPGPMDRLLYVAHGVPRGPLLHLQRDGQRLPARRGVLRDVAAVRTREPEGRGRLPRLAVRAGWPKCKLDSAKWACTGVHHQELPPRGRHGGRGGHHVGLPRHWHLPGRPHRGRCRPQGHDKDRPPRAVDAHDGEILHRPHGGWRRHGSHVQDTDAGLALPGICKPTHLRDEPKSGELDIRRVFR